ncbi:hypothetical protein HF086_011417 [Spodoptera exigua]|uniref:Retrotransposon gag domain-containing protein n=1 Tax=Spodoptera exigua TaxID=7107 RepID=A0A922MZB5_SPOEX|nr:hypothetical protein HF086_011417 [Spodoptera exigua]
MAQRKNMVDDKSLIFEEKKVETEYSAFAKLLPTYDGNRRTLAFYLENVENALELIDKNEALAISCLIRNKLKGKAAEALSENPGARTWTEIKQVLLRKFGEFRTGTQLVHALTHVTRDNTSLEAFGDRIRVLMSALITAEPNNQLETFLKNLNPITALSIKIKHVENLDQAIILAKQEEVDLRAGRLQQNKSNPTKITPKNKLNNKSGNYFIKKDKENLNKSKTTQVNSENKKKIHFQSEMEEKDEEDEEQEQDNEDSESEDSDENFQLDLLKQLKI